MKLHEYNLSHWKKRSIKREKKIGDKRILLLSIDRLVGHPTEGCKNLIAVNESDDVIWIADLPTDAYDSYIDMKFINDTIQAQSSNGFLSTIDTETGLIIDKYIVY